MPGSSHSPTTPNTLPPSPSSCKPSSGGPSDPGDDPGVDPRDVLKDILTDPTTYIPGLGILGATAKFGKKAGSLGKFKGTDALRRENKTPRDAANAAGLNKDQRGQLHDAISGDGLSYQDIFRIAQQIKNGTY